MYFYSKIYMIEEATKIIKQIVMLTKNWVLNWSFHKVLVLEDLFWKTVFWYFAAVYKISPTLAQLW